VVAGFALIGDVRVTWSFSAFTVLIYYALTNLSALQLTSTERLFPAWIAWAGLVACLFLAFWVDPLILAVGVTILGLGLIWHWIAQRPTDN
jgi:APA family basic amino acid/polyamine antiporter